MLLVCECQVNVPLSEEQLWSSCYSLGQWLCFSKQCVMYIYLL